MTLPVTQDRAAGQSRAAWRIASLVAKAVIVGILALMVTFVGAMAQSVLLFWIGAGAAVIAWLVFALTLLGVVVSALWKLVTIR